MIRRIRPPPRQLGQICHAVRPVALAGPGITASRSSLGPTAHSRSFLQSALRCQQTPWQPHQQQQQQQQQQQPQPQEPILTAEQQQQLAAILQQHQQQQQQQPLPPPPTPKKQWRMFSTLLFLVLGYSAGTWAVDRVFPPLGPIPGTPEDALAIAEIRARAARLEVVRELEADPAWESWDAYEGVSDLEATGSGTKPPPLSPRRITKGAMGGARGVGGYQRIFYNKETGEMRTVVWFGPALAGWPRVLHGGAAATILDESLGRCAVRHLPAGTGVTARLELSYRRPTMTNAFYVIRCMAVPDEELPEEERRKRHRKIWAVATLLSPTGDVCVEARGLFVVPKRLQLTKINERF